jgi:hypothetical protein
MIDPDRLKQVVRDNIERLCKELFPHGVREGNEWKIGDVSGAKGDSLGICLSRDKEGLFHDHATGQGGTFVELLQLRHGRNFPQAAEVIEKCLGISLRIEEVSKNGNTPFDWSWYVGNVTDADLEELAGWRGLSPGFCRWLRDQKLIGRNKAGEWAFPVAHNGKTVAAHCRLNEPNQKGKHDWRYYPKGTPLQSFVIGNLTAAAKGIFAGESQWDMFSILDRLGIHEGEEIAAVATRGCSNARLLRDCTGEIYLVPQNDEAGRKWMNDAVQEIGQPAKVIDIPKQHADANDWLKAGAGTNDLLAAMNGAKIAEPNLPNDKEPPPFSKGIEKDFGDDTHGDRALKARDTESHSETLANAVRILLPCTGKSESKFAEEVGRAVSPLGVVFRCDERVVEMQEEEFSGELDQFKLARGGLKFNTLTPARARTSLEQYIEFGVEVRPKKGSAPPEFMAKSMAEATVRSLLVSPQFLKPVYRIDRIVDVPIPIRKPNGEIVLPKLGFNPSLGIYCAPGAPEMKLMPIELAVEIIEQALAGFCWETNGVNGNSNPQSKIHAIARMITPYARGVMGFSERTPLWFFLGNRPRCGKDYLNGITQIIYLGHAFEDAPITDNYEETLKRIVSAMRAGRRMMHFANCQYHLNDPHFIQAVTGPTINARSLGSNDAKSDLELPNEIDYSLSANVGLTYRDDVEPRLRKIELAFFEEDPNKRTFPNPFLHDWIKANRGQVLSAIHSLFQHWISQGAPAGKTLFNSFPRWAEVVGGVMVTCGLGDPCLAHEGEDLVGGDLREVAMKALYEVAFESFPEQWLKKGDIYDLIREQRENNERLSWFGDLDGDSKEKSSATNRTGKALSSFRGRILGGIKLEIDASTAKSQQWRFKFRKVV